MSTRNFSVRSIILVFLKISFTAFGGHAAHLAMMEEEVVRKRKWITHEEFLDIISATNLIPGPNSTETALHIGYSLASWKGFFAAGLSFFQRLKAHHNRSSQSLITIAPHDERIALRV